MDVRIRDYWEQVGKSFLLDFNIYVEDGEDVRHQMDGMTLRALAYNLEVNFQGTPTPKTYGELGDMQARGTYTSDPAYMADRLHRRMGFR
jgi:hypothetical protein